MGGPLAIEKVFVEDGHLVRGQGRLVGLVRVLFRQQLVNVGLPFLANKQIVKGL